MANLDEILEIFFKTKHVCGLLTNDHFEPFWAQFPPFFLGGGGCTNRGMSGRIKTYTMLDIYPSEARRDIVVIFTIVSLKYSFNG